MMPLPLITDIARPLTLPAPFDTAAPYAALEYGHRCVSLTLHQPGTIARNQYAIAWITVRELQPWRGEPLQVLTERRRTMDAQRESFTTAGRQAVAAMLLPAIARYGFDRWWTDNHRRKIEDHDRCADQAGAARRAAAWWDQRAMITRGYAERYLDTRPIPAYELAGRRELTQRIVAADGRLIREPVIARIVMASDGEPVGWMTKAGDLIPDDRILEP
jgi:hypothetical protein